MPTDTTHGEPDDWRIKYEDGRWVVTREILDGSSVRNTSGSKGAAQRYLKSNAHPGDVVTVFTKSGNDWSTKYVRRLSTSGCGLFDDLG